MSQTLSISLSGLREAIAPSNGDKFSPNLHTWLNKHNVRKYIVWWGLPRLFTKETENMRTQLYIGWVDKENVFTGCRLFAVLSQSDHEIYCFGNVDKIGFAEVPDFWERYIAIGRCAIDTEHGQRFVKDESRWRVEGDARFCQWCGNCTQSLHKWTETVERQGWKNV